MASAERVLRPAPEPDIQAVIQAHVEIHRQERLADLLALVARVGWGLGAPCFIGCLLRDTGADAWYLSALYDTGGRATSLTHAGVPEGPFVFTPPSEVVVRDVREVLGDAWGTEACAALIARAGSEHVCCAPMRDGVEVRGVLLALIPSPARAEALIGVLAHAASAASSLLDRERAPEMRGVLDPATFSERAGAELARAARYQREAGVLLVRPGSAAQFAVIGRQLVGTLRRWDLVGRTGHESRALVAVLPETDQLGVRRLLARLTEQLDGIHVGSAIFPGDGADFDHLVTLARDRATRSNRIQQTQAAAPTDGAPVWVRGAPSGSSADTVRCPRCLVIYSYSVPSKGSSDTAKQARATLAVLLQADCPRHPEWLVVEAEDRPPVRTGLGGLMGRLRTRA